MWWMKTEFVDVNFEHGNWGSVGFETEAAAREFWDCWPGQTSYVRVQTLTAPAGNVVETRTLTWKDSKQRG
jgi:hypothetical protein